MRCPGNACKGFILRQDFEGKVEDHICPVDYLCVCSFFLWSAIYPYLNI